jgi:thiol-disulfide isomerase/thioredoxin
MKKNLLLTCLFILSVTGAFSQGYDIKINLNGLKDTTVYLARYFWDQVPVNDSCKKIKAGKIRFKGDMPLDKGVYIVANQSKTSYYFQFMVDENQKFSMTADANDVGRTMKTDDKLNEQFFSYIGYMTNRNKELLDYRAQMKGKTDSAKMVDAKHVKMNEEIVKFDADFMAKTKGSLVHEVLNLKNEKYPTEMRKASNGRPDSIYQYMYYKTHYFDGVNFKDDRMLSTPFFADRLKKFFDQVIPHHPDSVIKELDKVLMQCTPGSNMYNTLVGHFTYKYETNKEMSFDSQGKSNTFEKVFVHLADHYITNGQTNGYYSDETVAKIRERVNTLRNLLPGAKVSELYAIDTLAAKEVLKMGFDTARTSPGCTYLYNKNADRINVLFKRLSEIKAKYTVIVFWAADCGHCQTEVPKLAEDLKVLKGKIDFKVLAVQTKDELYQTWKKFIVEKKLTDFIHVFDPIHVNNLKEKFDIQGTPVIYLLDKDKRILAKKLATENVVDILRKLDEIEKNQNKQ